MSDIAPLVLTITKAGLAAFTAAQGGEDIDLTIAQLGVTAQPFVVAPTLTALPGEAKRLDTVSGEVLDDAIVHLVARDSSTDAYSVTGFGLFLEDGTLFAVYGGQTVILQKSSQSFANLALDLRFPEVDATQITFGDANFLDPPATETVKGVAYIATQAVVDAGADDSMIVTAKKLASRLASFLTASFASAAETITGAISNKIVHPAGLKAALDDRLGAGSPTAFIKTLIAAASSTTARSTLGLGNAATLNVGSAADLLAATAADKLVTPAMFGALAHVFAAEAGQYVFPGGLIFKWFDATANGNATTNIAIPTPYPTACVAAIAQGANPDVDAKDNNPSVNGALSKDSVPVYSAVDAATGVRIYTFGY
ncbi:gp53-like domain-containing protein [Sphingomonas oryzagri]